MSLQNSLLLTTTIMITDRQCQGNKKTRCIITLPLNGEKAKQWSLRRLPWRWPWGCRLLGCDTVQTSRRNISIATSTRLYGITFQHTAVLEGKGCLYFTIYPVLVLWQYAENKNGAFSSESPWIDFFQLALLVVYLFQVTHWQSPYMHAYFPALNSFPSLLGDMLADAINCLGFTWVSTAVYSSG